MSLKFISFAELLEIGGDSGVSGETSCNASVYAGFVIPVIVDLLSPPIRYIGSNGDIIKIGGGAETQQSCELQEEDPTDPTDPTKI